MKKPIKRFMRKIDGYNIYSVPNCFGYTNLVAYLNREKVADEKYLICSREELEFSYQHLIGIAKRNVSRT